MKHVIESKNVVVFISSVCCSFCWCNFSPTNPCYRSWLLTWHLMKHDMPTCHAAAHCCPADIAYWHCLRIYYRQNCSVLRIISAKQNKLTDRLVSLLCIPPNSVCREYRDRYAEGICCKRRITRRRRHRVHELGLERSVCSFYDLKE